MRYTFTVACYSWIRYVGIREISKENTSASLQKLSTYKLPFLLWSIAHTVIGFVLLAQQSMPRIVLVGIAGVLGFFYLLPIRNAQNINSGIRRIPFLKIGIVALAWTLICGVGAYAVSFPILVRPQDIAVVIFTFLFIYGLTFAFDIRDISWDKNQHLKTMASSIGIEKAKRFSIWILVVYLLAGFALYVYIPCYANYKDFFASYRLASYVAVLFGGIGSILIIKDLKEDSPEHYYGFGLDGMIIIQSVVSALVLNFDRFFP